MVIEILGFKYKNSPYCSTLFHLVYHLVYHLIWFWGDSGTIRDEVVEAVAAVVVAQNTMLSLDKLSIELNLDGHCIFNNKNYYMWTISIACFL